MVTKRTVFVLGAGASMPYGFPLGNGLVKEILDRLNEDGPLFDQEMFRMLISNGNKKELIRDFLMELAETDAKSIDEFLEEKVVYINVGKDAIAYVISRYENKSTLHVDGDPNETDKWYRYVWDELSDKASFEEIMSDRVTFVTFNYDRSIDEFIYDELRNKYPRKTDLDYRRTARSIDIIHIHGSIGILSWQPWANESTIPYGFKPESKIDMSYMSLIKIIHEESNSDHTSRAGSLMRQADQIVFLGLSYHDSNLEKLKIDELDLSNKKVFGTCYGMSPELIKEVMEKHPVIKLDEELRYTRTYEFLTKYVHL